MNITITARKFKAHDTLKEFINNEVSSLTRFHDNIHKAEVILSYQNAKDSVKTAEIILTLPGQILTSTEDSEEFKKSVSGSVEKLTRQLQKIKKTKRIEQIQ